jgi:hypothetical protein
MVLALLLAGRSGSIPVRSDTSASWAGGLRQVLATILPNGHAVESFYRNLAENGDIV